MAASPTYTYTFKVEPQMFRRALYFNTFGKQRIQSVIIAAMAVMGVGMLLANLVFHVEMTSVMQLCYIVISALRKVIPAKVHLPCYIVIIAAVPLLLFSCEHSYRDYKKSPLADAVRSVSINEDWLKFKVAGGADSEKIEWRQVSAVFELAEFFIIYRDANLMVLLPKSAVAADELPKIRAVMRHNLGRGFHLRRIGQVAAA